MPKSRIHLIRRKKTNKNLQIVLSEQKKVFEKEYLSPKGLRMIATRILNKEYTNRFYGKKKYRKNPNAKPIRFINHNNIYAKFR